MTGPWKVWPVSFGAAWLVSRYPSGGGNSVYAKRRPASGYRTAFWPTREVAERACARLNRKWAHECPGLFVCPDHPVSNVARLRVSGYWSAAYPPIGSLHLTHQGAFAAALAYAKEKES